MRSPSIVALCGLAALAACDVQWGGSRVALEDPAPARDTAAEGSAQEDEALPPLPEGPLFYLARLDEEGSARVVPAARPSAEAGLADLPLPDTVSPRWRARFDSTFLPPGRELRLHAAGRRIGTLVVGGARDAPLPGCPSVAGGTQLLVPGQAVPSHAVALPAEISPGLPARTAFPEPTSSMNVAGPVLAERLIDDERAYLARRADLEAVRAPGDSAPAMAATYLVGDSLAAVPAPGPAISLFFLARYDPGGGYVPEWFEVRRYEAADEKEAFAYLDWFRAPAGRVDLLRRVSAAGTRLAAGLRPEGEETDREVTWTEPDRCPALELLAEAALAGGPGAAADGAGSR